MITSIYVSIDEGATIKEIRNLSPEEFKQLVLIIQQLMDGK